MRWWWWLIALGACGRIGFAPIDGDEPADALPPACVAQVAAGRQSSCAIDLRGDVWCWGANEQREVSPQSDDVINAPVRVSLAAPAVQLGVGAQFACARLGDGRVQCWGSGGLGKLGTGNTTSGGPFMVALGGETAVDLQVGMRHACIRRMSDGGVMCWGNNAFRQLADPLLGSSSTPIVVPNTIGARQLSLGHQHVCGLDTGGSPFCWGRNGDSQLSGTGGNSPTQVAVPSLVAPSMLAAGGAFSCALDQGAVRCWGVGAFGSIGAGDFASRVTPGPVVVTGATQVSLGSLGGCALLESAEVTCWGHGETGSLGDGTLAVQPTPVRAQIADVTQLAAGARHVCALSSGRAWCWGQNHRGQLGRGTTALSTVPVRVVTPDLPYTKLAVGSGAACAATATEVPTVAASWASAISIRVRSQPESRSCARRRTSRRGPRPRVRCSMTARSRAGAQTASGKSGMARSEISKCRASSRGWAEPRSSASAAGTPVR